MRPSGVAVRRVERPARIDNCVRDAVDQRGRKSRQRQFRKAQWLGTAEISGRRRTRRGRGSWWQRGKGRRSRQAGKRLPAPVQQWRDGSSATRPASEATATPKRRDCNVCWQDRQSQHRQQAAGAQIFAGAHAKVVPPFFPPRRLTVSGLRSNGSGRVHHRLSPQPHVSFPLSNSISRTPSAITILRLSAPHARLTCPPVRKSSSRKIRTHTVINIPRDIPLYHWLLILHGT